jgi:hypothetical protein
MPPNTPVFKKELIKECETLANKWSQLSIDELKKQDQSAYFKLDTIQKLKVLNLIGDVSQ